MEVRDERVLVAGDWNGDANWLRTALERLRGVSRTLLHVGDFGLWEDFLSQVDECAEQSGIDRMLVTPGNHEDWGRSPRSSRPTVGARSVSPKSSGFCPGGSGSPSAGGDIRRCPSVARRLWTSRALGPVSTGGRKKRQPTKRSLKLLLLARRI